MFEVVNRYDKYVLIVDGRSGSEHTAPLVIDLPAPPRLIRKWERRTPDVPATVTSNYLLDAGGVKVLVTVVVEETAHCDDSSRGNCSGVDHGGNHDGKQPRKD